jgi:hypothetical protein
MGMSTLDHSPLPPVTRRREPDCDLFYLCLQEEGSVTPLLGCERSSRDTLRLPCRPSFPLEEGGLLLVAVRPVLSPDGRPWEERRLWRVI